MAFLLLMSSTGFSMNLHFCGHKIQDIQFYHESASCNMLKELNCNFSPEIMEQMKKNGCCNDQHFELSTDESILKKQNLDLSGFQIHFISAFIASFVKPDFYFQKQSFTYLEYSPPLLEYDFRVLYQSFII